MTIQPKNSDLTVRRCPFCGSGTVKISNTHTACYTVACETCGAEVTGRSAERNWKTARSKVKDHLLAIRDAVKMWNRRSPDDGGDVVLACLDCSVLWGSGARFTNMGGSFGAPRMMC